MAEYLIYAKEHWYDKKMRELDPATLILDATKFAMRYMAGDIVQVYEDGSCREDPSPDSIYAIVKVPKLHVDNNYVSSDEGISKKKRKFRLNMTELNKFDKSKIITLTIDQFNSFIEEK